MKRALVVVLGLIVLATGIAKSQISLNLPGRSGAAGGAAVRSRVLADTSAVAAGKAFTVAVELTTNPNWHIYWTNPGDGGLPTTFKWTLPEGYKAEAMAFPMPERHVQPGDITVFGYEGRAAFLFKIVPPEKLTAGQAVLSVSTTWLCCSKDECTPGDAKLELKLPVGEPKAANEAFFAAARAALPVTDARDDSNVTPGKAVAAKGGDHAGTWTLPVSFKEAPKAVDVFPEDVEGLAVSNIKIDLNKQDATINLTARILGGQTLSSNRLPLLVVYTGGDGKRHGFPLSVDLTAIAAPLR